MDPNAILFQICISWMSPCLLYQLACHTTYNSISPVGWNSQRIFPCLCGRRDVVTSNLNWIDMLSCAKGLCALSLFDRIANRLPRFKVFSSSLPRLLIFQVNSNVSYDTEIIIVFRLSWFTTVIFKLTCVIVSFRMRKPDHTMLSVSVGNMKLCKNACHHVSFEPKEWLQMMDSDLKYKECNDTQQSTGYQKQNRGKRGLHRESAILNRGELGLQSLSGCFFRRLRNQSLIVNPGIRQSKWDSTINQWKGKPRNILIASAKKETVAKIAISKFSAIVPAKPNPKKGFVEHVWVFYNDISLDCCSILVSCHSSA